MFVLVGGGKTDQSKSKTRAKTKTGGRRARIISQKLKIKQNQLMIVTCQIKTAGLKNQTAISSNFYSILNSGKLTELSVLCSTKNSNQIEIQSQSFTWDPLNEADEVVNIIQHLRY